MDLNAIRKRLGQLQTTNNRTSSLWKPQPGKTQIRIVPYAFNKENPFIELFFHYNLNNRSYLSPISFGRPDPIEEFAQKLKASGNKEDYQLSKKLEAKMRTFAPVIVRGEESQGVKFWGFGKTIYTELLSIVSDPDYGDITDLMNGRDIDVEFIPAEGGGYPKTTIRVKPNTTPATEDKGIAEKIMNQPVITDIFPEPTYEELETALKEWMNPDDDSADVDTSSNTTSDTSGKTEAKAEAKTEEKQTDVASAFNDLFNK